MPAVDVVSEIVCAHGCCRCSLGVEVYLSLFLAVCTLYAVGLDLDHEGNQGSGRQRDMVSVGGA